MPLKTTPLGARGNKQTKPPVIVPAASSDTVPTFSNPSSLATAPISAVDAVVPADSVVLLEPPSSADIAVMEATLKEDVAAYDKTTREEYARYTSHLWEQRRDSQADADKLVLTLSSASLALSATVLKDVIPNGAAAYLPWLFLGWTMFGVSIVSTLSSYHIGRNTIDAHIDACKPYFFEQNQNAFDEANENKKLTEAINNLSSISFVFGLTLTLIFIGINVWEAKTILNTKKTSQTVRLIDSYREGSLPLGATPPPPPALPKPRGATSVKSAAANQSKTN